MACPYVSGLAALIWSKDPSLTNYEVRGAIQMSADDIGQAGKDDFFGYGRINAWRALEGGRVSAAILFPSDQTFAHDVVDIQGSAYMEKNFGRYELYYASMNNPQQTTLICSSTTRVENGLLGRWETADLREDERYLLILKVISNEGKEIAHSVEVTIDNINQPPVFVNLVNQCAVIGRIFEFRVKAQDPDDPAIPWGKLEYSVDNLPPGAQFNPQTQVVFWQPADADKGVYEVTFTARDSYYSITKTVIFSTLYIEENPITDDDLKQGKPNIYGDTIVWLDEFPGPLHGEPLFVYMYNLITQEKIQISPFRTSAIQPKIYENKIIWTASDGNWIYNTATSQLQKTKSLYFDPYVDIYGDNIVYGGGFLCLYNLAKCEETTIWLEKSRIL